MQARTTTKPQAILAVLIAVIVGATILFAQPSQAQAASDKALTTAAQTAKSSTLTTQAQKTKVHKIYTAQQWHNIAKYNGGTFKIMRNIKLTSEKQYLTINKNKKYVIDLNGKKVATTYSGTNLRTVCPLLINKGTVVMKTSNKKNKGVLYSTETTAVTVLNKGKFYLKSGSVVDDAVEFRSDIVSAIFLDNYAKCYIQGKSIVQSIGNGICANKRAKVYTTGAPYIRAGANNINMQFSHYGSGICVTSKNVRLYLKGGSFGTKATPDMPVYSVVGTYWYAQSANYPILDTQGVALTKAIRWSAKKGYKFVDPEAVNVPLREDSINSTYPGLSPKRMMETWTTDARGFYAVYMVKK